MSDHEAFLKAIFKQPDDQTARLVYADWLDENDHPGGELIRVRHELAQPGSAKSKRALIARERKLVVACDQDWLEHLEHADWKLRYLKLQKKSWGLSTWLRQRETYWRAPTQKALTRAIAEAEKEIGKPLPRSWKAFAHGCGPGWLVDHYGIAVPKWERASGDYEWMTVFRTLQVSDTFPQHFWLRSCVPFGSTGASGGYLVWNTAKITDPVRNEYEIVLLDRYMERSDTFKSFESLWTTALTPEAVEEYDAPFDPS